MSNETWKDVAGWPYQVSSLGNVRRVRYLSGSESVGGYIRVEMNKGNETQRFFVHRLVAAAFHGPCPPDKGHAAHRDGNPKNNRADNVYWATPAENNADRKRHGRIPSGATAPNAKLTEDDARLIRAWHHIRHENVSTLSRMFGVSRPTIERVISNESYKSAGGYGL